MLIACARCHTVNRVPDARLADDPVCGRCKQALLPDHPVDLDDASFDAVVGATELPVVVDVWAPWCGPCRMMAPQFEQAARELKGQALFARLNSDDNPRTAVRHRIRSIPTVLLLRGGRETDRRTGAMWARDLVRWLQPGR
ncbi:thioredoxin TrxC [Caldimonas thermodepolymerans]|jgi:thioredoxin 2|uniref:thioredoxin TrxC n=1 Tax=Caldimonas thermodepolymerans TaxID=215580 RepID=UPI002235D247|nr:thioredoxin TrxC [Caldimonas thermodepolymerans]UZG44574.1 thioredoxin TrxC [Caldimonas thermodepolymerans]